MARFRLKARSRRTSLHQDRVVDPDDHPEETEGVEIAPSANRS